VFNLSALFVDVGCLVGLQVVGVGAKPILFAVFGGAGSGRMLKLQIVVAG
jgi:hypothetical protein